MDKPTLAKIILNAHELFKIVEFFRPDSFMLFNCCVVSAIKHLFNGHVLSVLHLFVGHKNDLIQWCFVLMSQVHMTLGHFAGSRSEVFLSHLAPITGGYHRWQPKSAWSGHLVEVLHGE
jgi:hypothetical protein